ncbi:amylo-alpha-1,6-glucosidase [Rubellimicrobium sp. CFH 75288]|uniref:amylo-alpha-1,6-glucosidase n=1 Tax=Rubellimicrobium sp. CFH 75288 TaxID=2697034 RepID=UPI0014128207|nr:amylo-alpha-1,6-glucosidase [Rubellimicrobium sp. CFH 75288]NAZ36480.1 amylo-alpha-1,6-glucosidase [Rubellimicrobium sp. CFH 75288]
MDATPIDTGSGQAAPGPHAVAVTTSLAEQRLRILKSGDAFAVLDPMGDVRPGSPEGVYFRDTRYLSRHRLVLGGQAPILLSSTVREDNAALTCDLANPDLSTPDGETIPSDTIHVRRTIFLWDGRLHERLKVRNFGDRAVSVTLAIETAADFADIFEVRGEIRAQRGRLDPPRVGEGGILWTYRGLDGRERATHLRLDPAPARLDGECARFDLRLGPGEWRVIVLDVTLGGGHPPERGGPEGFRRALRAARRALRRSAARAASVETSNEIFNEAIRRSVSDIYMLATQTPHGAYPYAGVPWFSTVFGRDALIAAFQTLWMDPELARGVLGYLAANQATDTDPAKDCEPGKILHEVRQGEMAETGEVPFRRYYGSVDSTPLFVMLAGAHLDRTGDVALARRLWPAVQAALGWMENHGDRDGDGFLEYGRMTEAGLLNQGWKDSHDSIFHADGRLAQGPIALCEVQAYAFGAWSAAARLAEVLGQPEEAARLRGRAAALRDAFEDAFWCPDLGTYALALDGEKRPCRVRASNAGHALWTGIARPERAAAVARTLMGPSAFSGWGVRTVATGEARYNPMSYHNGSVWPHDNALIAMGLARYGLKAEAARIFEALFDASIHIDLRRLPELFCGFPRLRGQGPTFYPVACSPQAWAAATPVALVGACLGLGFDPASRTVELRNPVLPGFLDRLCLRNLHLDGGTLDLVVRRAGDAVAVSPARRSGEVQLRVTH